jgi:hypothetical protein
MHAPTNRVGDMVPTMTAPENETGNAGSNGPNTGTAEHKAETVHPPTKRVGEQVPTMKSPENKDEQQESKTYYQGKDSTKTE